MVSGEDFAGDDWEASEQCDTDSLQAIPAYSRGFEWGLQLEDALLEYLEGAEELEPDAPLMVACTDSLVVAARIAGGHGMGYDDDVLCGNIVCCRQALVAAARSVTALEELAKQGSVPAAILQPLIEEGRQVKALVEQRVTELRSRVWWQ